MTEHNIEPVYDEHSEILILGSFPSVKSRENRFFTDIRRTDSGKLFLQCMMIMCRRRWKKKENFF